MAHPWAGRIPALIALLASLGAACSAEDAPATGGSGGAGGGAAECQDGAIECTADALTLRTCAGGRWEATECMRERGQLCEAGACVDPWRYGSPTFDQCAGEPRATAESLAEKAQYFEEISRRLHVHPDLGWMSDLRLPCAGSDCSQPGIPESTATWADVTDWGTGENDGLWSALYMGAEAYRWAVTRDPEALAMLRVLVASEEHRMAITGVPGIFTRQMIPPGVQGIACPTDLARYVPDVEKDDNQWVRVGSTGCLESVDGATLTWQTSSVCGLEAYAGWCFLDNVSEDEYAGHLFGLGAVAKLVDDPDIQAAVRGMLARVGDHLMENQLTFVDWDGRVTEHGRIWAGGLVGGYNAAMSLSFLRTIALATGEPRHEAFYQDCLLQRGGENLCIERAGATRLPYDDALLPTGLNLGCKANWNNYAMYMLSLHGLLWGERDPEVRAKVQAVLETEAWAPPGYERPLSEQNNAFFDFIYAAGKALGPGSPPATAAVENGVCMLRQFPAHKVQAALTCPPTSCVGVCQDRFDRPMTDYPRPVAERCLARFVWWGSPYSTNDCAADAREVKSPADYLLAYWMGRYYGFIAEGS